MDRNLPVEMMIRDIEDIQIFLLANPADNMELTDVQLCTNGLIKIPKTGGLYTNATEKCNLKDRTIRQQWMEFKTRFIDEYEKMLAANGGTTMGQDVYGTGGVIKCDRWRQFIIIREHGTVCREGNTNRRKSEQVREQAGST